MDVRCLQPRRPALLDSLIDRTASDLPPSVDDIAGRMRPVEGDASYEVRLDRIRVVTGDYRFALGTQLIEATQAPIVRSFLPGCLTPTDRPAKIQLFEAAWVVDENTDAGGWHAPCLGCAWL